VAAVNWWNSVVNWARTAWNTVAGAASGAAGDLTGIWRYITSVASAAQYMMSHPFTAITNGLAVLAGLVTGNLHDAQLSAARAIGWYNQNYLNPQMQWVRKQLALIRALIASDVRALIATIVVYYGRAKQYAWHLVATERRYRIAGDKAAEAYTRQQVRAALALVQREAASGYALTMRQRMSLITRLADVIVTRDPLVKDAVNIVIRGLLDILAIDDPLARLALGFAITHIIDSLGLDKVTGQLLRDLVAPILGNQAPSNLHDVVESIGNRLNAVEAQWAQFYADGGPEILQAGEQWRDLTSLIADAGLLAFFGLAVTHPRTWAADTAAVAGPAVRGAAGAIAAVLK
jgi:hypothetical protein